MRSAWPTASLALEPGQDFPDSGYGYPKPARAAPEPAAHVLPPNVRCSRQAICGLRRHSPARLLDSLAAELGR